MAKELSKTGITTGNTVDAHHVTQSIDAFAGTDAYDITLSGSLTITGSVNITGSVTATQFSGSFSGSFQGDGSGLTGIISASYAISASHEITYETSSSYSETATSASYADVSISASYAPSIASTTQSLSDTLTIGDTTSDGQSINALNGTGSLNLRDGSVDNVTLTNDPGQTKSGVYLDTDEASLFADGWNRAIQMTGDIDIYNINSIAEARRINLGLDSTPRDIVIAYNVSASVFSHNANKYPVFISSKSSSISASVVNSVALGGTGIFGKTNETAYVKQIGFHETASIEGILSTITLTQDTAWQLPKKSGILALKSNLNNITGSTTISGSLIVTGSITSNDFINANYTVFRTLLTQISSSAPTASILENTSPFDNTSFYYSDTGSFYLSGSNVFPSASKVEIEIDNVQVTSYTMINGTFNLIGASWIDADKIEIRTSTFESQPPASESFAYISPGIEGTSASDAMANDILDNTRFVVKIWS